jgi:S1-C subfamily serine protease
VKDRPAEVARSGAKAKQIVEAGEIRRGSLGITLDDATPDVVRELKTPRGGAVIVKFEPRSSGARAGLKLGDTVTEVCV